MTRVLIAEDEPSFRELLESALRSHGYETRAAGSGREAIEVGARFRPHILVADWMLRNHYHGLHVAETVRLMQPQLQTILVTGFGSRDVGYDATQIRVFDLIHKPFDFGRLLQTLDNAVGSPPPVVAPPPFAVVEVDRVLRIVHRNARLRDLLAGLPEPMTLDACFAPGRIPDLEAARHEWQESVLRSGRRVMTRARIWHERPGYLLVLLPIGEGDTTNSAGGAHLAIPGPGSAALSAGLAERELELNSTYYGADFLVRALLDLGPPGRLPEMVRGRALVVDGVTRSRRGAVRKIEHAGVLCHSADELLLARRLLEHDPGIELVLADHDLLVDPSLESGLREWLGAVRGGDDTERILVAQAQEDQRGELRRLGVDRFVRQPWEVEELIATL